MTTYKLKSRDGIILATASNPFTILAQIEAFLSTREATLGGMYIYEYPTDDEKKYVSYSSEGWIAQQIPSLMSAVVTDIQAMNTQIAALNAQVFPKAKDEPKE